MSVFSLPSPFMSKPKRHFLPNLRRLLALLALAGITLAFLGLWDGHLLTGIQLLPALLAANLLVVGILLLLTLLFGRVYCSVICPLGIMQDALARLGRCGKKNKLRYRYAPARNALRYTVLALFIASMAAGIGSVVALLAPYSAYGRIVSNLLAPLRDWGNNALAWVAEQTESYAFAETEVWIRSLPTFLIAAATFLLLALLAWRYGRAYCNTLCPVGTLLGLLSRFSLFGIRIDRQKCISCGLCARQCKAACINPKEHAVDASRCVACMNCLSACSKGAIRYGLRPRGKAAPAADSGQTEPRATEPADPARRHFLLGAGALLATTATHKHERKGDGGLADIADKVCPARDTRILPPGARSHRHFERHCTGCQLCVSACPNGVLRPSAGLLSLMQPECSYERGYCRPECTRCSQVCPAGAIERIDPAEKSSLQVGHAVWRRDYCVVLTDGVRCGNCARHCPVGAITMVPADPAAPDGAAIPVIDEERCIGCGACEHLCPARPHSAICVEGHEQHRSI